MHGGALFLRNRKASDIDPGLCSTLEQKEDYFLFLRVADRCKDRKSCTQNTPVRTLVLSDR